MLTAKTYKELITGVDQLIAHETDDKVKRILEKKRQSYLVKYRIASQREEK